MRASCFGSRGEYCRLLALIPPSGHRRIDHSLGDSEKQFAQFQAPIETYLAILDRLKAEMLLSPVNPNGGGSGASLPSPAQQTSSASFVDVFGIANVTKQTGQILAVRAVSRGKPGAESNPPLTLRAIDASGKVLGTYPAGFHRNSLSNKDHVSGSFVGSVRADPNLRSLQLVLRGDTVLDSYTATSPINTTAVAPAPALKITQGSDVRETTVRWGAPNTAASVGGRGNITYDVEASGDGGKTWRVLGVNLTVPQTQIDLTDFVSASTVQIRVLENSGFVSRVLTQAELRR